MSKIKSGFTLIDVVISTAIMIILGGIVITSIAISIKNYKETIDRLVYMDKIDNCMINIDLLCNSNGIKDINVVDRYGNEVRSKSIVITYFEKYNEKFLKDKVIHLSNDKLMVKTLSGKNNMYEIGNNVLIDKIESFNIYKKDNLIYFTIITKFGDEITRCL